MGGCEYEVKRELNYLVEMRQVNQQRKVGPVAAFEFALLRLATKLTATPAKYTHDYLSSKELARGILPTLKNCWTRGGSTQPMIKGYSRIQAKHGDYSFC